MWTRDQKWIEDVASLRTQPWTETTSLLTWIMLQTLEYLTSSIVRYQKEWKKDFVMWRVFANPLVQHKKGTNKWLREIFWDVKGLCLSVSNLSICMALYIPKFELGQMAKWSRDHESFGVWKLLKYACSWIGESWRWEVVCVSRIVRR